MLMSAVSQSLEVVVDPLPFSGCDSGRCLLGSQLKLSPLWDGFDVPVYLIEKAPRRRAQRFLSQVI